MSQTVERVKTLFDKLENEKNSELFSLCVTQVALLYAREPIPLHLIIFNAIRKMIVSKQTFKRQIGAALFERIIDQISLNQIESDFFFESSLLKFDIIEFIDSLDKHKREKGKSENNFENFVNLDIVSSTHDSVTRFFSKKENFLFSKSEKSIQAKEKASKLKLSGEADEIYIDQISRKIERNEDLNFFDKTEADSPTHSLKKVKKTMLVEQEKSEVIAKSGAPKWTSIFDSVFQIARYLVFHVNWEFRHGALLIFRAVSRKFDRIISICGIYKDIEVLNIERNQEKHITKINSRSIADISRGINEDIKQKCLILLALDRFSDFLNDKSNMTNRALGAEILVTLFGNVPNVEDFYFLFEFLFLPTKKHDWEPKQAYIFLLKKLIEKDYPSTMQKEISANALKCGIDSNTHRNISLNENDKMEIEFEDSHQIYPSSQSKILRKKFIESMATMILDIMSEHEEVTDIATQFCTSVAKSDFWPITTSFSKTFQQKLILKLLEIDDIGYLPKAVFENFSVMLLKNELSDLIIENFEDLMRKFLFHDNSEVRQEIFIFLANLLTHSIFKLTLSNLKFIYVALVFYYIMKKEESSQEFEEQSKIDEETKSLVTILKKLLLQVKNLEVVQELIFIIFKIQEKQDFREVISDLDVNFSYNIEKSLKISHFDTVELIIRLLDAFDSSQISQLLKNLNSSSQKNSLVLIPFLFHKHGCENILNNTLLELLDADLKSINLIYFNKELQNILQELDNFLCNEIIEISLPDFPTLESIIEQILTITDDHLNLKANISELHNCIVKTNKEILVLMEEGKISFTKNNLIMVLEKKLIPRFRELFEFGSNCVLLLKAGAAAGYLEKCCLGTNKIQFNMNNKLLGPFLTLCSGRLSPFFAHLFSEILFKLIPIYKNEEKQPNNKLIESVLRRSIDNKHSGQNFKQYIGLIFQNFGETAVNIFPNLESIFIEGHLCSLFIDHIIKVQNAEKELAYVDRILSALKSGKLSKKQHFESILCGTFEALHSQMLVGRNKQMDDFLKWILVELKQKNSVIFSALKTLLDLSKKNFLPYAKIFLKEVIVSVNDSTIQDKSAVFEVFSMMLTLSHIDVESSIAGLLSPQLAKMHVEGKNFLFEFKNPSNFAVDIVPILDSKLKSVTLREYQVEGIKWIYFLFKYGLSCILCDDMGLGKTIQSLCSIALIHKQILNELDSEPINRIDSQGTKNSRPISLIICPNSLITHWRNECVNYIDNRVLNPVYLLGNSLSEEYPLSKFAQDRPEASLFITSYNILNKIREFFDIRFKIAVIDEAHLIKNPKNKTSQTVKLVQSDLRLALTGTPIQNKVTELWSVFDFLMPQYLGKNEEFNKEFKSLLEMSLLTIDLSKMHLSESQKIILETLHRKVLPFIMRREKTNVLKDLPDKIIQDYHCEMTDYQTALYDHFEKDSKIQDKVQQTPGENNESVKMSFFTLLSAMRKILNHPSLLNDKQDKPEKNKKKTAKPKKSSQQEKMAAEDKLEDVVLQKRSGFDQILKDLLNEKFSQSFFNASGKFIGLRDLLSNLNFNEDDPVSCIENDNKILMFTRSNGTLKLLEEFFTRTFPFMKVMSMNKSQNQFQRAEIVDKFNNEHVAKVLLLTPKIGGLGLNLSSANIVIMFDHDFNPMNDLQAMDRAHRLGQKKTVNVFRMITQGTIEEQIMGIQKFKMSVAQTVINAENNSIKNIQDSNFLGLIDSFAQQNVQDNSTDNNGELLKAFGSIGKYLKNTDLQEIWDEDEYDREFLD